ncbi:MAG TPA: response regulator [Candidatus Acidoferrales bacterium]|nr:response regulator [Candidatus Acidoferrales bacterium]
MASTPQLILLVDDEENALTIRKLVLEQAGYDVLLASGARQALDTLAAQAVNLVLSDQLMPGMNGVELTREIKKRWPRLPVLLLSGVNELPEGVQCADGFLSKTEGPARLLDTIAAMLTKSRVQARSA